MYAFLIFKNSVFVSMIVNEFKFVYLLRFSILHNPLLLLCRRELTLAWLNVLLIKCSTATCGLRTSSFVMQDIRGAKSGEMCELLHTRWDIILCTCASKPEMMGRQLSQEEAKRLLAKFEQEDRGSNAIISTEVSAAHRALLGHTV